MAHMLPYSIKIYFIGQAFSHSYVIFMTCARFKRNFSSVDSSAMPGAVIDQSLSHVAWRLERMQKEVSVACIEMYHDICVDDTIRIDNQRKRF
jgi:hypothetical protein